MALKRREMKKELRDLSVNFGPQHPAAHGVLRLVLDLEGEVVRRADPHIGLLHRGTEKLMEYKTARQGLPYRDRLDYVSMMAQEHTYCRAVEKRTGLQVSARASLIRMLFLERTRILNHRLAVSCHALDVGAMTPYFRGFEEREKLMGFYERVSGARMHAAYVRPGGVARERDEHLLGDMEAWATHFEVTLQDMENLLDENPIWKRRLVDVGVVSAEEAKAWGFSGVMLRGSGVAWDLRVNEPYERYEYAEVRMAVGSNGDCYDRYKRRMAEMKESLRLMLWCMHYLEGDRADAFGGLNGSVVEDRTNTVSSRRETKATMEGVIEHFKGVSEGEHRPDQGVYAATEAPKGEFGVYLSGKGDAQPNRVKFKAPGFAHLQALDRMTKGHLIADVVTVIGTQDIVFGEVDR